MPAKITGYTVCCYSGTLLNGHPPKVLSVLPLTSILEQPLNSGHDSVCYSREPLIVILVHTPNSAHGLCYNYAHVQAVCTRCSCSSSSVPLPSFYNVGYKEKCLVGHGRNGLTKLMDKCIKARFLGKRTHWRQPAFY